VPAWQHISTNDIILKKMGGLSNAVYKVTLKQHLKLEDDAPRTLLFRYFEQDCTDKRIE